MTDYSAAPAGSRTDILVAEHVRGWTPWLHKRGDYTHVVWQKDPDRPPWFDVQHAYREAERTRYTQITGSEIDSHKHINELKWFMPSTSWIGLGVLMEHLMAEGHYVQVTGWREDGADDYVVRVQDSNLYEATATADGLPLAVCRAALVMAEASRE